MNTTQVIDKIRGRFSESVLNVTVKNDRRATIDIDQGVIVKIADYLHTGLGFRFIIATALHSREGFELYYHFSCDQTGLILNIHSVLPHENPAIESLTNLFEASNWIEREIHELFGIDFRNHPNLDKLISEGNWAEDVYPYRKNYK